LKTTGRSNELKAKLSRYLKGTLDDVEDTLSAEEHNIILNDSITGKTDFQKLEKEAGISNLSPDVAKTNKSISENCLSNR